MQIAPGCHIVLLIVTMGNTHFWFLISIFLTTANFGVLTRIFAKIFEIDYLQLSLGTPATPQLYSLLIWQSTAAWSIDELFDNWGANSLILFCITINWVSLGFELCSKILCLYRDTLYSINHLLPIGVSEVALLSLYWGTDNNELEFISLSIRHKTFKRLTTN